MERGKLIFVIFAAAFFALGSHHVEAASFFMLPKAASFNIGEEFSIDLKINATDEFLNAGQATVTFPPDVLELQSADKAGSAFNFWVEEPAISNETGTVSFTGGTARGISGSSLQVLKLKFKTKGTGGATLSIKDAVVTASDGKGTNILSTVEDASVRVGTQVVKSEIPSAASVPKIEPKPVTRQPVLATQSPDRPIVTVPLYPDSALWYNRQGDVIALWNVPDDIIASAVVLDHKPDTVPSVAEPELTNGKKFGVLAEGTWYIHVRFKNNVGWGKVGRYRINIDTTAPLSFDATIDSEASDNPTPSVGFSTADSLSGIGLYQVSVDNERLAETDETSLTLPVLLPGKHALRVRASDKAGNSTESTLPFEILPLETPIITFYTETISQSETLFASGTALPELGILFEVKNSRGTEIFREAIHSDKNGKWEFRTPKTFSSGNYFFTVTAVDSRGAQSFPTTDSKVRVRALVLFSLGSVDIGWFEILILILIVTLGAGTWLFRSELERYKVRGAYSTVISRDVVKFADMLGEELEGMRRKVSVKKPDGDSTNMSEFSFRLDKMADIVAKMKKYLSQEIGKMRK